jgi:molybdopterin-guanine dinucleotide biosynthesis protein A
MQHHPDQRLLLCPIDMPQLNLPALQALLAAAQQDPVTIHVAHDGRRCQPLLGVYPSSPVLRQSLFTQVKAGERKLQRWLAVLPCRTVELDPQALRNVNRADELHSLNPCLISSPSTSWVAPWGSCDCH